jgi:hypothetical protein
MTDGTLTEQERHMVLAAIAAYRTELRAARLGEGRHREARAEGLLRLAESKLKGISQRGRPVAGASRDRP